MKKPAKQASPRKTLKSNIKQSIYIQFKLASHTQSFNVLRIALNHNNSYFTIKSITINLIHKSKV
jgi:hypothetical protein